MPKTYKPELTERQVTLIRVALLQRMNNIKDNPACAPSYRDSRELLTTGPLSLAALMEVFRGS